ncbi:MULTISPECIES: TolC family protein [unclassified Bradyrhizobium]|uniref:TolC family protein n=1 Tax=unclassified Bradyrhizobium TaxID=2631580 RepID=UPI001BAE13D1|nr:MULTISPECIES: TolC family protein [unclassified Bradyrhizobium]MBR1208086.1 TolC family protein [Bradyrhizobium sp. AUGA SZCCT0124]MBR1316505.1 TolC family protein [Bradyrhizobium sp. AUGA SZCCT0051]MBR1344600.1 TolC family protein [Bradyrhizobium sp. AUGA SZCCT0105]MBR1359526.1 TolC family protein [Bradyrhizobium sp. AUGA SZCCT0045]
MTRNSHEERRRPAEHGGRPALLALTAVLLLSGCATFSPDGGMTAVADIAGETIKKDVISIRTTDDALVANDAVKRLLRRTLNVESAVQVALLSNRGLQAAYNELALAEADLVQESLPPNPTFSISRISGSGAVEIERQVVGDILALATLPFRSEIARQRFRQAQLRAALETLRLAAEVRRSYYRAVAANELVGLLADAKSTAESTAQLALKLGQTGSLNKLDQAREQVFYAETTAELGSIRQEAASSRERLARLMGLWGSDLAFQIPNALPALPRRASALPFIEVDAVSHRIDLQIARIELDALARSLNLTEASRFVTLLDVAGIDRKTRDPDTAPFRERGFDIQFQIPIFDGGEVRVRQAAETYNQSFNRLTEKAINVRSEARDAYRVYRSTYEIAGQYQREVLPLRKIITEEMQLRFSSMQIDVFALLTEARQRIASLRAGIEAKRDFWFAQSDLQTVVNGGGSGESQNPSRQTATAQAAGGRGH